MKRTPADKDGGVEPKWGCDLVFDVVDQYLMDIEVWHQGMADLNFVHYPKSLFKPCLYPYPIPNTNEVWHQGMN